MAPIFDMLIDFNVRENAIEEFITHEGIHEGNKGEEEVTCNGDNAFHRHAAWTLFDHKKNNLNEFQQ